MNRLDRYILSVFVPALLLFGTGLLLLAIFMDLIISGEDFLRLQEESPAKFAARYYLLRLPLFLRLTMPAIPLLAAAFTVVRLSRRNELVPMAASGVNLRRVYIPFLGAALLFAAAMASIEEWILPPLMPEIAETEALLAAKEKSYAVVLSDARGNRIFAPIYDHNERMMLGDGRRGILVVQIGPDGLRRRVVRCEEAAYDEDKGGWMLRKGVIKNYVNGVQVETVTGPDEAPTVAGRDIPDEGLFISSDVNPAMIRRGADTVSRFVNFAAAKRDVQAHPEIPGHVTRLTDKFTYPFSTVLILMLGLPFVSAVQAQSLVGRSFLCLAACILYYVAYLVGHDFVNQQIVPAAVGCWTPTVLFGCLAAAHYGMIKT